MQSGRYRRNRGRSITMNGVRQKFAMAAAVLALVAAAAPGVAAQGGSSYQLSIVSPPDESTVFSDSGDVAVKATIAPPLAQGERIEFLVDGMPAGPPTRSLEFSLSGTARGQHLLQARVIDTTGNVAAISQSDTFYSTGNNPSTDR
jgi:hypothetical protein